MPGLIGSVALALPPEHHRVDERLGLLLGDVPEGHNELVKGGVHAGAAYLLNLRLRVKRYRDALVQLLLGLCNEGREENMEGIFPYSLLLVFVVTGRVRVVMGVVTSGLAAMSPLHLAPCWVLVTGIASSGRGGPFRNIVHRDEGGPRHGSGGSRSQRRVALKPRERMHLCPIGGKASAGCSDHLRAKRAGPGTS